MGEPHQLDVRLDGVLLKRFTVGGEGKGMTTPENYAGNTQGDPEWEKYMHTADRGLEVRVPVKAGPHEVGVSFVQAIVGSRRDPAAAADGLRPHDQRVVLRISRAEDGVDRRSVQRRPARANRRRAARCSSARRKTRQPKSRARGRFFRASPRARIAGRSPRRRRRCCSTSIARAARKSKTSTPASSAASSASWPRRASSSG